MSVVAAEVAKVEAAAARLTELVDEDPMGCSFCPADMPDHPVGWTVRELPALVQWRVPSGRPGGRLEAGLYTVCPACGPWIAGRRVGEFADALCDLIGLTGDVRGQVRAELTAMLLAVVDQLGEPVDLAEFAEGGER